MSVVVDASVVIALVVADERQAAVRTLFEGWLADGEPLHAPAVLPYDVANVLAKLVFDGTLPISEVAEAWQDLDALGLVLHPFDLTVDGPDVTATTAQLRRRHATDARYICLARRLGTAVWTLDGAFAGNAAALGLPVCLVS